MTKPINDADVKEIAEKLNQAKFAQTLFNDPITLHGELRPTFPDIETVEILLTKLAEKEAKLNQAVEALEWIVECGTDYQSINKARNALCEIKGGEKDE